MTIQAEMTKLATILASGAYSAAAATNIATLTKLGADALLAHGASEETVAAQIFPLANRAIHHLRTM